MRESASADELDGRAGDDILQGGTGFDRCNGNVGCACTCESAASIEGVI